VLSHRPEAALALHPIVNVTGGGIAYLGITAGWTDNGRIYPEICTAA
jgi:hypothetical protein